MGAVNVQNSGNTTYPGFGQGNVIIGAETLNP